MRNLGWFFLGVGLVTAMLSAWFGRENVILLTTFGLSFVFGSLILLTSFTIRLYRGEIRLRFWDASKLAAILFIASVCLRLLLGAFFFPDSNKTLTDHVLASAFFSIFFSLYQTAYRKPA